MISQFPVFSEELTDFMHFVISAKSETEREEGIENVQVTEKNYQTILLNLLLGTTENHISIYETLLISKFRNSHRFQ